MSAGNKILQQLSRALPVPGAGLAQSDPQDTWVRLWLMALEDTDIQLDTAQITDLWHRLPYWAFAWAGGRALAGYLMRNPHWVAGQRVLDFGCGSGIVGITAALCGASEVWVADLDDNALLAVQENARLNQVRVNIVENQNWPEADRLLAADVLYDISASSDLQQLLLQVPQWLLAETRQVAPDFVDLQHLQHGVFATLPAIGDFDEAVAVEIYCRRDESPLG